MAHPLGALLGQYMLPVGGVPFESSGGVALEAFGRPAIGLDLWHFLSYSAVSYRIIVSLLTAVRTQGNSLILRT